MLWNRKMACSEGAAAAGHLVQLLLSHLDGVFQRLLFPVRGGKAPSPNTSGGRSSRLT